MNDFNTKGKMNMTCEDCKNRCLHYDLCESFGNVPNDTITFESCNLFKDKSLFVELPCKAGNTLWCINDENEIEEVTALGFIIDKPESPVLIAYREKYAEDVYYMSLGSVIFMSREVAKEKMNEKEVTKNE